MKKTHRPLVVGNWKMNPQTVDMATRLATDIKKKNTRVSDVEVVIAPPTLFIPAVHKIQSGSDVFCIAAQDAHWEKLGAHTGEVSIPMLQGFGITYVILGHSERRKAGETDAVVVEKMHAVMKAGLSPIVCVGEETRDHAANYLNHIEKQVKLACAGLSKAKLERLVIAYEPVWAIGTGKNATPDDVHEMKLFIQKVLADMYGRNFAEKVRVLYGGSVNEKNAAILMEQGMVDGFLVGGASLHADEFTNIIKAAL